MISHPTSGISSPALIKSVVERGIVLITWWLSWQSSVSVDYFCTKHICPILLSSPLIFFKGCRGSDLLHRGQLSRRRPERMLLCVCVCERERESWEGQLGAGL